MKKKEIIATVLIVFLFIIWFLYSKYSYNSSRNEIMKSYNIAIGHIISYSISGDANDRTLIYEYEVNGSRCSRYLSPKYLFDECQNDITLCLNRRFHVIYSINHPEISLIDLSQEIVDINSSYVNQHLNNFE